MEDEVFQTSQPTSDVVTTTSPENTTGYVQEPTVDPSQSSAVVTEQPTPPAPKTERELAYEEINRRQIESYNSKGNGIKSWIDTEYNYNPADAGTLWVAGKINDVNTQMSFLEATLNEDLYSEMDLKKYFFDTNLATARAYAKEKKHETAYGFYRAAEEKAIAEGQLTGWYMPAEAGYMLSQWVLAEEDLKKTDLSDVDRARAQSVKNAVSGWFEANNITEQGIKCLNLMYLEETIRHNKESERLQEEANNIQKAATDANNEYNLKSLELREKQLQFQVGEMEKDMGYDLNMDNIIGHTGEYAERFGYYKDQKEWVSSNFGTAFQLWGSEHVRTVLGDDYREAHDKYKAQIGDKNLKESMENNGDILDESYLNKEVYKVDANEKIAKDMHKEDKNIRTFTYTENGKVVTKAYYKDKNGVYRQITEDIKLKDGSKLSEKIPSFSTETLTYEGTVIQVGNKVPYNELPGSYTQQYEQEKNKDEYRIKDPKVNDAVKEQEKKGYKIKRGYYTREGKNSGIIMENEEGDLVKITEKGKVEAVNEADLKEFKFEDTIKSKRVLEDQQMMQIGSKPDGEYSYPVYVIYDKDGEAHFYVFNGMYSYAYGEAGFEYKKISQEEAQKYCKQDIETLIQNERDYQNGTKQTVGGKNSDAIMDEYDGAESENRSGAGRSFDDENTSSSIKKVASAITNNDGKANKIEKTSTDTQKASKTSLVNRTKSTEEQVLDDYDKYVTAFEQGEIQEDIEKNKEDYSFLGRV